MNRTYVRIVIIVLVLAAAGYLLYRHAAFRPDGEDYARMASTTQALTPHLAATWQSTEDAKFTRAFSSDGKVTDRYEGLPSATETGTWSVVDPAKVPDLASVAKDVASTTVIGITYPDGTALYFGIERLTDSSLDMTYLSRGNTLDFVKVQ